jgi:GDP-L-fucose synthase
LELIYKVMGDQEGKQVFVAGHNGMVGSAITRLLQQNDKVEIITRNRNELDLENKTEVDQFFHEQSVGEVYLCAAKVGGIHANNEYPAEFIYKNLIIESNLIHASYEAKVRKLLFLGSSCIYPRECPQPIKEEFLLNGSLEPTNEPYAIAKIAGIKLCESYNRQYGCDFRSVMPTNLYGPNDNFHPLNSHVIPGLMRRIHEAVENESDSVEIWGSGSAKREFLHVDDMASACVFLMELDHDKYSQQVKPMLSHINVGCGEDVSIFELAHLLSSVIGFKGELIFDQSKPDGTPRKLLCVDKLHGLGWQHKVHLRSGLKDTYRWFVENV